MSLSPHRPGAGAPPRLAPGPAPHNCQWSWHLPQPPSPPPSQPAASRIANGEWQGRILGPELPTEEEVVPGVLYFELFEFFQVRMLLFSNHTPRVRMNAPMP
jgi:hypothetical protein